MFSETFDGYQAESLSLLSKNLNNLFITGINLLSDDGDIRKDFLLLLRRRKNPIFHVNHDRITIKAPFTLITSNHLL